LNSRTMAFVFAFFVMAAYAIVTPAQADDDDEDDNDNERRFFTVLSGNEEVPFRDTRASGSAQFQVNEDGTEVEFRLRVSRIRNVFAAHIHCGTPGVNGAVGVTLYMGAPGEGRFSGTLAKGSFTGPDAGNGCGWTDLSAVLAAIQSGASYVNVHTNDGVDPPNTGPGDFPGGEIRGHPVSIPRGRGDVFTTSLSGDNEVPARDTDASGRAFIFVNRDATELHYVVTASRISNVFMAHIHCGAEGANGPIGVTLYGMGPTGQGPRSGVLVIAMKAAPDTGNACGWETLADVVAAMETGDTYVNVHTNDGVDPGNTGPGDFPGGEIRGQLRSSGDDDDDDDDDD
jgi:hypothetical protein